MPKTAPEVVKAEEKRMEKAEKSYVAEAVREVDGNEGVFPAAIAELGQAACDRLTFLQTADASSIPAVLASNEIPQAAVAIKHLCPEFAPQLKKSSAAFGDGERKVGKGSADMVRPGRYFTEAKVEECSWAIFDKKGNLIGNGSPLPNTQSTELEIPVEAKKITSTGCYAWMPSAKSPATK